MTTAPAHSSSPLLAQVQTILRSMGYAPVAGDTGMYMRPLGSTPSISGTFYIVSQNDVQVVGELPVPRAVPHARFVADNVQYLFR